MRRALSSHGAEFNSVPSMNDRCKHKKKSRKKKMQVRGTRHTPTILSLQSATIHYFMIGVSTRVCRGNDTFEKKEKLV